MTKVKPGKLIAQPIYRHGEGHVIEVVVNPQGNDSVANGIDLGNMPVPDRKFASDTASVLIDKNMVKLLFAQRQPIGDGLLSLLVINMTFESIHQLNATVDEEFAKTAALLEGGVSRDGLATFTTKADQTVILNAGMVLAGYSGGDSCMDFFYSSPFAVRQVAIFKKIAIEPIVRVNLPTGVLLDMLDFLREAGKKLPAFNRVKK